MLINLPMLLHIPPTVMESVKTESKVLKTKFVLNSLDMSSLRNTQCLTLSAYARVMVVVLCVCLSITMLAAIHNI